MYCRSLFFLFVVGLSTLTFANEKVEEVASAAEIYSGKQDQSWEHVQGEVVALKGKLDAQASVVQALVSEKMNLKGDALNAKIEDIKKEHVKYEKLVVEYNKKNEEFLTRYPERGLKAKRVYKRLKIKSLVAFEDDVTLSGRMNKLHKKVLQQYPKAFKEEEKNKNESTSGSENENKSSEDVTTPIYFKK